MSETTKALAKMSDAGLRKYDPSDLRGLVEYAKWAVRSELVPKSIATPQDFVLVVQTGRELGLSTMASIRNIYVIYVKGGRQISISAKLARALAMQHPKCEYFMLVESTAERAVYRTKHADHPEPVELDYTWAEAESAGLTDKDNWKNYPKNMLRHRAAKYLADEVYPDATGGLYLADELGVETDDDGVPVDPRTRPDDAERADIQDAQFEAVDDAPSWDVANRRFHAIVGKTDARKLDCLDTVHEWIKRKLGVEEWKDVPASNLHEFANDIEAAKADWFKLILSAVREGYGVKIDHDAQGNRFGVFRVKKSPENAPDSADGDPPKSGVGVGKGSENKPNSDALSGSQGNRDSEVEQSGDSGGSETAPDSDVDFAPENVERLNDEKKKIWRLLTSAKGVGDAKASQYLDAAAKERGLVDRTELSAADLEHEREWLQGVLDDHGPDELSGEILSKI